MRVFRFNTKVSSDGTIQIPYTPSLFEKEVELIIVPKSGVDTKTYSGKNFVKKWAGFLKDESIDSHKNDYLSDSEIYRLSDNHKTAIDTAINQIENGDFLTNEQSNKEIDEWLNR